jgi:hypothetical protein
MKKLDSQRGRNRTQKNNVRIVEFKRHFYEAFRAAVIAGI